MIVVTGGAGFIGSAFIWYLNELGRSDIAVVDRLGTDQKWLNLQARQFERFIHADDFLPFLKTNPDISAVIHMGACSTTTEADADFLMANNTQYSMDLWDFCTKASIPFIYASSAATYGGGEQGYDDSHTQVSKLMPINKYGFSKQVFDRWVLRQKRTPPRWAGLKFFNVYGPQEFHKGAQASVIFHAFHQIKSHGSLKLFKSYRADIAHGEQKRDFVYIKDVVKAIGHCLETMPESASGLYNIGTGIARTFHDLGKAVFAALDVPVQIEWVEMPDSLRSQYQYFTEAKLEKLRAHGKCEMVFSSLEDGARDYVQNYLNQPRPFL